MINIQVDLRIEHKELVSAKYAAGSPVAIDSDRCTCYSRGWEQAMLTAISTPNFLDARTCNKQKQLHWQTCQATTHNEMHSIQQICWILEMVVKKRKGRMDISTETTLLFSCLHNPHWIHINGPPIHLISFIINLTWRVN